MSYIEVTNDSTSREDWLRARKRFITASEVACILDVGFQSPKELAAQKKQGVVADEEDEIGKLAFVAAGRHMEHGVCTWFAEETAHLDFRTNRSLLALPGSPFAATPDALIDGVPVEAKMVRFESFSNWTQFGSRDEYAGYEWASDITFTNIVKRFPPITMKVAKKDLGTPRGDWRTAVVNAYEKRLKLGPLQPPLKYVVQLHVQMYVLGAPHGWITCCAGGDTRLDFQVARSAKLEQYWLERSREFIESIGGLPA